MGNPELHGSELTMTNNYLPQHSRDLSPKQRPGLPPKQSSGRGMDASNRSAGSRNSPRGMNVSDRSMGSRTKSSSPAGTSTHLTNRVFISEDRAGGDLTLIRRTIRSTRDRARDLGENPTRE